MLCAESCGVYSRWSEALWHALYHSTTTTSCYTLIRLGNNFESCTQLHVLPKKGTDRTTAYTHIKISSFLHPVYMLSTEISLYKDLALQLKFCPTSHISWKIVSYVF